jgi:hypothetical protein
MVQDDAMCRFQAHVGRETMRLVDLVKRAERGEQGRPAQYRRPASELIGPSMPVAVAVASRITSIKTQ